jgi:DNA-binding Lrp family transcriptional regulator
MILNDLISLPQSAVYALIDEDTRRIYVHASYDVPSSLVRLAKSISIREPWCRNLADDIQKLKFVILEADVEKDKLKLRYNYWLDAYVKLGYSAYHVMKNRVEYHVETVCQMNDNLQLLVWVYLVNKRRDKTLVGVFNNLEDADAFRKRNYADGVYDVVYDDGTLSMRYIKKSDDGYEE